MRLPTLLALSAAVAAAPRPGGRRHPYSQTVRHKVRRMIHGRPKRKSAE